MGSKVSGTVVDVCDFGAFINIGYATRGSRAGTALLHISQIQDSKIENIHDVIKVGDTIEGARVTSIDLKKCEVGLSLRSRRQKRRDFSQMKMGDQLEGKVTFFLALTVHNLSMSNYSTLSSSMIDSFTISQIFLPVV